MFLKSLTKSRAFTLLELLIVLLIIGILIAIGLYRYQSVQESGHNQDAKAAVRAAFINGEAELVKNNGKKYGDTNADFTNSLGNADGLNYWPWLAPPVIPNPNPGSPLPVVKDILVYLDTSEQSVIYCNKSKSAKHFCMAASANSNLTSNNNQSDLLQLTASGSVLTSSHTDLESAFCYLADKLELAISACDSVDITTGGSWSGADDNSGPGADLDPTPVEGITNVPNGEYAIYARTSDMGWPTPTAHNLSNNQRYTVLPSVEALNAAFPQGNGNITHSNTQIIPITASKDYYSAVIQGPGFYNTAIVSLDDTNDVYDLGNEMFYDTAKFSPDGSGYIYQHGGDYGIYRYDIATQTSALIEGSLPQVSRILKIVGNSLYLNEIGSDGAIHQFPINAAGNKTGATSLAFSGQVPGCGSSSYARLLDVFADGKLLIAPNYMNDANCEQLIVFNVDTQTTTAIDTQNYYEGGPAAWYEVNAGAISGNQVALSVRVYNDGWAQRIFSISSSDLLSSNLDSGEFVFDEDDGNLQQYGTPIYTANGNLLSEASSRLFRFNQTSVTNLTPSYEMSTAGVNAIVATTD